jgi:hypothetical protein
MWYRVDIVLTDVSEERIDSIFRVEESTSEEPALHAGGPLLPGRFLELISVRG